MQPCSSSSAKNRNRTFVPNDHQESQDYDKHNTGKDNLSKIEDVDAGNKKPQRHEIAVELLSSDQVHPISRRHFSSLQNTQTRFARAVAMESVATTDKAEHCQGKFQEEGKGEQ